MTGSGDPIDSATIERAQEVLSTVLELEMPELEDVAAIDVDPELRRWYLRLEGVDRDYTTIWFTLRQRTVRHETYFMPGPIENHEELYRFLMKLNHRLVGVEFSLDGDGEVYLVGHLPVESVDAATIDRVVGTVYATVEQYFKAALRIGYASRFG